MLHGDFVFVCTVSNATRMQTFLVGVALLACVVHGTKEMSTMELPAERRWRLGRLHAPQHRSTDSEKRREH